MRAMQLAVSDAARRRSDRLHKPHGTAPWLATARSRRRWPLSTPVQVSATKSTLGHSLGASGAVETAVCALAMKERTIPPMRNLTAVADGCADLDYVVDDPREAPDLRPPCAQPRRRRPQRRHRTGASLSSTNIHEVPGTFPCHETTAPPTICRDELPSVSLPSTSGDPVDLSARRVPRACTATRLRAGLTANYLKDGTNTGARGVPPVLRLPGPPPELQDLGACVSAEHPGSAYQREAAGRLHLPFGLLTTRGWSLRRS